MKGFATRTTSSAKVRTFIHAGDTYQIACDRETGAPIGVTFYSGKTSVFLSPERISRIGSPEFISLVEAAGAKVAAAIKSGALISGTRKARNGQVYQDWVAKG